MPSIQAEIPSLHDTIMYERPKLMLSAYRRFKATVFAHSGFFWLLPVLNSILLSAFRIFHIKGIMEMNGERERLCGGQQYGAEVRPSRNVKIKSGGYAAEV